MSELIFVLSTCARDVRLVCFLSVWRGAFALQCFFSFFECLAKYNRGSLGSFSHSLHHSFFVQLCHGTIMVSQQIAEHKGDRLAIINIGRAINTGQVQTASLVLDSMCKFIHKTCVAGELRNLRRCGGAHLFKADTSSLC